MAAKRQHPAKRRRRWIRQCRCVRCASTWIAEKAIVWPFRRWRQPHEKEKKSPFRLSHSPIEWNSVFFLFIRVLWQWVVSGCGGFSSFAISATNKLLASRILLFIIRHWIWFNLRPDCVQQWAPSNIRIHTGIQEHEIVIVFGWLSNTYVCVLRLSLNRNGKFIQFSSSCPNKWE